MSAPELHDALARVLGAPSGDWLRPDTILDDIGVDALARVLLVDACRESGIDVDADRVWCARTMGDLVMAAEGSTT